jgi:hypothetical protein
LAFGLPIPVCQPAQTLVFAILPRKVPGLAMLAQQPAIRLAGVDLALAHLLERSCQTIRAAALLAFGWMLVN